MTEQEPWPIGATIFFWLFFPIWGSLLAAFAYVVVHGLWTMWKCFTLMLLSAIPGPVGRWAGNTLDDSVRR